MNIKYFDDEKLTKEVSDFSYNMMGKSVISLDKKTIMTENQGSFEIHSPEEATQEGITRILRGYITNASNVNFYFIYVIPFVTNRSLTTPNLTLDEVEYKWQGVACYPTVVLDYYSTLDGDAYIIVRNGQLFCTNDDMVYTSILQDMSEDAFSTITDEMRYNINEIKKELA